MKMQPISILEATPEQRRKFATDFLGIDLEPTDTDDTVFGKITAANGNSEMMFIAGEPDADAPVHSQAGDAPVPVAGISQADEAPLRMQGSFGREDPKVEIFINNEDRNGEIYDRDVAVGVNGTVWLLQRNKPLMIPYRVYSALQDAVRDSITHNPNTGEEHSTPVKAVPFNVQAMPSAAEIAEWRKTVDAAFCP